MDGIVFCGSNETVHNPKTGRSIEVSLWREFNSDRVDMAIRTPMNILGASVVRTTREDFIRKFNLRNTDTNAVLAMEAFRNFDELFPYEASKSILMQ